MNLWKYPYLLPEIDKAIFKEEIEFELNSFNKITSVMKLILTKTETYCQNLRKIILVSGKTLNDIGCSEKPKKLLTDIMEYLSIKIKQESDMQEKFTEIIVNSQEYVMSINNDLNYKLNNLIDEGENVRLNHGEVKNIKSIFLKNLEVGKRLGLQNVNGVLDSAILENERVKENLEFCFRKKISDYNDSVNRYHLLSKKLTKEKDEFLDGIKLKGRSGFRRLLNFNLEGIEEFNKGVTRMMEKSEEIIEEQCQMQSIRRKNVQNSIFLRTDVLSPDESLEVLKSSVNEIDDVFEERNYEGGISDLIEFEEYISAVLNGANIDEKLDLFLDILKENEGREMFLIVIKNHKFENHDFNLKSLNSFYGLLKLVDAFIQVCERNEEWGKIGQVLMSVQEIKFDVEDKLEIELRMRDHLRYSYIFSKREFWVEILNWLVQESIISNYQMDFGGGGAGAVEKDKTELTEDVIFKILKENFGMISNCYFGDIKELIKDSIYQNKTIKKEDLDTLIARIYESEDIMTVNKLLKIS